MASSPQFQFHPSHRSKTNFISYPNFHVLTYIDKTELFDDENVTLSRLTYGWKELEINSYMSYLV